MAETPTRVQRRRTKGYRLPPGTVSVTRPGRWGNPYRAGDPMQGEHPWHGLWPPLDDTPRMTAADAVRCFRFYARAKNASEPGWLEPLRGMNLACFCPLHDATGAPVPCHADVLLELANASDDAR